MGDLSLVKMAAALTKVADGAPKPSGPKKPPMTPDEKFVRRVNKAMKPFWRGATYNSKGQPLDAVVRQFQKEIYRPKPRTTWGKIFGSIF